MIDTLVVCYHAVSPTWDAALSVTPSRFEAQVRRLLRRGYRAATFSDAVDGTTDADRVMAITFDDAYCSVPELALPILRDLGVPATLFVPTAHLGSSEPMTWPGIDHWLGGPHERELVPATGSQLTELLDAGWEIGSHTHTHPRLTEVDEDALAHELSTSRELVAAATGETCRSLAYPYGATGPEVAQAADAAGYSAACTLQPRELPRRDRLMWPRVGIYHRDNAWRFAAKCSPIARRADDR